MKYKVKITKQPKYQTGGEQNDNQKQIMMLIQQYAQKTGVDPQTLVHKLQQLKPEEQQQALQQMQQALQGEQQPQSDMGYDTQQPEMAHGGRVAHQQQVDPQQQQQLMQLISVYAQMEHVDPKIIMQKLHQLQPQQQQEAIQQMVQSVQQAQQSQPQEQDPQQSQQESQMQPMAAYGGQMGYGLDLRTNRNLKYKSDDEDSINRNIDEVDRSQANIEAEDGETALIPYKGDSYLHKNIVGNKHTEGGVPLKVPEGTFIYSDTKKMKLGGPVLQMFGKPENTTKKYTPADIAKQYNIDKYTAIINNPKSDAIAVRTAELMIQNYEKKLAQLALVQESKKGFPQGIPEVAKDYYQQMQQATQASAPQNQPQETQEQQQGQDVDHDNEQGEQPQAQYGGGLEEYQTGREFKSNNILYNPLPDSVDVTNPAWTKIGVEDNHTLYNKKGTPGMGYNVPKGRGGKQDPNSWMYAIDRLAPQGATLEDLKKAGYLSAVTDPKVIQYWNSRYKAVPQSTPDLNYYTEGSKPTMSSIDEDWDINPPGQGQAVDIKGLNTAFALPGVNLPQIPNNQIVSRATVGSNPQTSQNQNYANHNNGAWSTPDKLGMLNSILNLAGVKKYSPFEPTAKLSKADTYYVDPNRALAANAEQANSAKQSAAMFAGPQSRYSYNDGQFGANAANIISQYANQNAGIANNASQQNNAIDNQQMEFDTQRAKRLYDAGVIGEQQYQNAIRQAKEAVLQSYTQGYSNAGTLYNMNATTAENYIINPRTGKLEFNPNGGKENFLAKKSNPDKLLSLKELQDMADLNKIPLKQVMEWYKINNGINSKTSKVKKAPNNTAG